MYTCRVPEFYCQWNWAKGTSENDRGRVFRTCPNRLVRTFVFPIFLNAAETWTLREIERKKIRRSGNVVLEKDVRSFIIEDLTIKQSLSAQVQIRILKFFGRESDSNERLVVLGRVEVTRPRGRSPMLWTDQIRSAVGGPLHECARMTANRQKWREIVKKVVTARNTA